MKLKLLLVCLPALMVAQQIDTAVVRFSKYVTAEGMKKNLTILASDEYEGRETGQKGQKMSAEYISKYYKDLGIPPLSTLKDGYQQTFPLEIFSPQELKITTAKKSFIQNTDYYTWTTITGDTAFSIPEIEFCGYGINTLVYNDYDKIDVKNKAVMILAGEPYKADGNSLITQTTEPSIWTSNFRVKQTEAKKQGIKYLLIVDTNIVASFDQQKYRIKSPRMSIDTKASLEYPFVIYISKQMADEILTPSKKTVKLITEKTTTSAKTIHFTEKTKLDVKLTQAKDKLSAENVMAYIEGTDLKNELLVLSAHYDHLGHTRWQSV
jgi:hypothetical protein